MKKTFLLVILFISSVMTQGADPNIVTGNADPNIVKKLFFGLRLGESIQDVSKKHKVVDVTTDQNDS